MSNPDLRRRLSCHMIQPRPATRGITKMSQNIKEGPLKYIVDKI